MNERSFIKSGVLHMPDKETKKQILNNQRREQILNAAVDIFAGKGYTAATVLEIARKAGLAPGTIYLYFPSKRELFIKVIENLVVIPLISQFAGLSDDNFRDIMQNVLRNRLEFFRSGLFSRMMLLMSEIQRDPELKKSFYQTLIQPLFHRMSEVLGTQVENGTFRSINPEIIPRLIGSMMIGLAIMQNIEGETSPFNEMSVEAMTTEVMNFVMWGVMNSPAQSAPREA
jgi:AcrR family transcriptional regulator